MIKKYDNLETPSPETVIWRYMDTSKFLSLVMGQHLFFSRMDILEDKYEGSLPPLNKRQLAEKLKKEGIRDNWAKRYAERDAEIIKSFTRYILVNCWSINEYESYASWRIYLNNQKLGVAIQSTVGRLESSLEAAKDEVALGQVIYIDPKRDSVPSITQQVLSTTKTKYYVYEQELRALIFYQKDSRTDKPLHQRGKSVEANLEKLIEKIYLSPMAPSWYYHIVKELLSEALDKEHRLEVPICPSALRLNCQN